MNLQHIEVFVDALVMMSVTLIIIVTIDPRARVIDRHLMNELGEADTIQITLDRLLLCLLLTHVLRLRLRNLVLGPIHLIRLMLNRCRV